MQRRCARSDSSKTKKLIKSQLYCLQCGHNSQSEICSHNPQCNCPKCSSYKQQQRNNNRYIERADASMNDKRKTQQLTSEIQAKYTIEHEQLLDCENIPLDQQLVLLTLISIQPRSQHYISEMGNLNEFCHRVFGDMPEFNDAFRCLMDTPILSPSDMSKLSTFTGSQHHYNKEDVCFSVNLKYLAKRLDYEQVYHRLLMSVRHKLTTVNGLLVQHLECIGLEILMKHLSHWQRDKIVLLPTALAERIIIQLLRGNHSINAIEYFIDLAYTKTLKAHVNRQTRSLNHASNLLRVKLLDYASRSEKEGWQIKQGQNWRDATSYQNVFSNIILNSSSMRLVNEGLLDQKMEPL